MLDYEITMTPTDALRENARTGPRADPAEIRTLRLRAHELLADVPLHDCWRIRLRGGDPATTVSEVIDLFLRLDPPKTNRPARFLFGVRAALGRLFGWDRPDPQDIAYSYIDRLSREDRARSHDVPGSKSGFWTTLYTFDREALGEVINRTVHAFLLFALEPAPDGFTLYWGIYVKPVNRFTPVYMALIDPFRRHLIYPALIRRIERRWWEQWMNRPREG